MLRRLFLSWVFRISVISLGASETTVCLKRQVSRLFHCQHQSHTLHRPKAAWTERAPRHRGCSRAHPACQERQPAEKKERKSHLRCVCVMLTALFGSNVQNLHSKLTFKGLSRMAVIKIHTLIFGRTQGWM